MMISRRKFLIGAAMGAAAAALPRRRRAAADSATAKNLIMVYASGGWDVTYVLDPKPDLDTIDAPAGEIVRIGNLDVWGHASRPNVTDFFTQYGSHVAIMNGVQVQSIAHLQCARRMLTGSRIAGDPDIAAITAHGLGRELPVPYLAFGNSGFYGPLAGSSGRVGLSNQVKALLTPEEAYLPIPGSPADGRRFDPTDDDRERIRQYVAARSERAKATRGQRGYNAARIQDFQDALDRGDALRAHADSLGPRGVGISVTEQALFAVDAIAKGVAYSVLVEDPNSWDTHGGNFQQTALNENLYGALTLLMQELTTRDGRRSGNKMIDETVVMVVSEMGRTPRLNGAAGKDHWPSTSCMVMGAGIRGDQVCGATDSSQAARTIDFATGAPSDSGFPLMAENVLAAVAQVLGVPETRQLSAVEPLNAIIA